MAQDLPIEFLRIDNARVEKIENSQIQMCGFVLNGFKGSHSFYCKNPLNRENWLKSLSRVCVSLNISSYYTFGKMLGKGNFAKVHLAWRKGNNKSVAVKTMEKAKILQSPRTMQSLYKEISIMRKLSHPNVIRMYEVYENESYVHLVIEYLKGGELFQKLQAKGLYSEKDASVVVKSLLEALNYCHSLNIVHRDLKAENLILAYGSVKI